MRKKLKNHSLEEYIKAARKGNREAEQELLGPGFHSRTKVFKSAKVYSRKVKHKGEL